MTTDHMIQSENSLGYVRVKHAESPKYLIEEFSVTEADSFYSVSYTHLTLPTTERV